MKVSLFILVIVLAILCEAFELPFRQWKKSEMKHANQRRKLPSVFFTRAYFHPVNVRQDPANGMKFENRLLESDFDVLPVTKRLSSLPSITNSPSLPVLLKYDPRSFSYEDFFPKPNQLNTTLPDGSSIIEVYALPPDTNKSIEKDSRPEAAQEDESQFSLYALPNPSDSAPEIYSSIQTTGDDYDTPEEVYPNKNAAASFTEVVGRVVFGLPLLLGYLRVVTYLNALCSSLSTTCSEVTVTDTTTATVNLAVTETTSSTLTAFFTFTQTFLFSQTTTFLTITITRSTLTMTTTSYLTSIVLRVNNPIADDSPLDNIIEDSAEAMTFYKPVIEATLVPYVYTTYEVIPITQQVVVSTVQPVIDVASLRQEQIVFETQSVNVPKRSNNKFSNLVDQKQEQDNNNAVNEPVQDNPEADQESHNQGIHLSVLVKKLANYYLDGFH